jgi:hypothetical protein
MHLRITFHRAFAAVMHALLRGGVLALAGNLLFAASAQAAPGQWNLTPWTYTDTSAASTSITTSTLNSEGAPSIGMQVIQSATTNSFVPGLGQTLTGGATSGFSTVQSVNGLTGASVTVSTNTQLLFSPMVSSFGPAAGQGTSVGVGGRGFNYQTLPVLGASLTGASTITITLAGGGVFGNATPQLATRFAITGGGAGSNFVTFTWNPASPAGVGIFRFWPVINGPVSSITVAKSFVYANGAIATGTNNPQTESFGAAVDPAALPVDVAAIPTLSEWATFGLAVMLALLAWWRMNRAARPRHSS